MNEQDEQPAPSDDACRHPIDRRVLLERLAALGLAHVTIVSIGGAARAQGGGGGGGGTIPPPAGSGDPFDAVRRSPAPTPGPTSLPATPPQPGCGSFVNGQLVTDLTCGTPSAGVGVAVDRCCGKALLSSAPQTAFDLDCGSSAGGGNTQRDEACALLASTQPPAMWRDVNCGKFQSSHLYTADGSCGLQAGIDLIHMDLDCGLLSGSNSFHADNDGVP